MFTEQLTQVTLCPQGDNVYLSYIKITSYYILFFNTKNFLCLMWLATSTNDFILNFSSFYLTAQSLNKINSFFFSFLFFKWKGKFIFTATCYTPWFCKKKKEAIKMLFYELCRIFFAMFFFVVLFLFLSSSVKHPRVAFNLQMIFTPGFTCSR